MTEAINLSDVASERDKAIEILKHRTARYAIVYAIFDDDKNDIYKTNMIMECISALTAIEAFKFACELRIMSDDILSNVRNKICEELGAK